MKNIFLTVLSIGFVSVAFAEGRAIRHKVLREKIFTAFKLTESQKIVFKRFPGLSRTQSSIDDCEVQLKSSPTQTTIDIIFPHINRSQESVTFSYDRDIMESNYDNQYKYSSHYTACNGDQYDTYRECWQYDHYNLVLMISDNDTSRDLTLTFKGSVCTIMLK